MSDERPAKRIRHACEPCRRKKSRCPGEKPICSHCARLRQNCFYAEDLGGKDRSPISNSVPRSLAAPPSNTTLEDRLKSVESQLAEVLSNQSVVSISVPRTSDSSPRVWQGQMTHNPPNCSLPPPESINIIAEAYLLYCDCQPLPLFHSASFIETIHGRDRELLCAIIALSVRFCQTSILGTSWTDFAEESRTVVMGKVVEGTVELSTLQTLCLLSLIDFTNGNTKRASMHSSLAINLAQIAGLISESPHRLDPVTREERRRCFWSLLLLKRLHGAEFGTLDVTGEDNLPWYPESAETPTRIDDDVNIESGVVSKNNQGILAITIQLSETWLKITQYARRRGKPSSLPPWSPQSEYATIMAQQMESETRMPKIHRFKPAQFSKHSTEDLHVCRDYWGPWIFAQFIYHTNICLLNHPLLLSLRLRNFQSQIPEMFLQSTSDLISSHASWITHLIGMFEAKSFKVTDPFLGHCAAIVATIYLQESFVDDLEIREEKMGNFTRCLGFVRGFIEWPHIGRLADKLEKLRDTLTSAHGQAPHRNLLIDLGQFWEILEYSSSSEIPGKARELFGASLYSGLRSSTTELAHTSSLPQPTRVDAQDFASNTASDVGDQVPFLYSDEELAVLEESFFQQRPELEVGLDDWGGIGNL